MQTAIDRGIQVPACSGCRSSEGVAPSVTMYREPYFCIHCCNYLDIAGRIEG
ncbi:MAG TPA: hypothetical protein VJZ68_10315 [Nitrososphaera sp.]|nr:hypothetical protein [Nitrososphaera sp.]